MAHILVADDRRANFEVLEAVLVHHGHTIEWAVDGEDAWSRIGQRLPDLVITDLVMPNLGGEGLVRRLRGDPRTAHLPVVIHTASYRSRQARSLADALGVRWILPKPSEPRDLLAMVADALGEPMAAQPTPLWGHTAEPLAHALPDATRPHPALLQRFDSIVNLGLGLAFERDADGLVTLFGETAQRVFRARYVGVVLLAPDGGLHAFDAQGFTADAEREVAEQATTCEAARLLALRADGPGMLLAARPGDFTGLPPAHPPVHTFMACRIAARDSVMGWMWIADGHGGLPFPVEDERLLQALAAMLGSFHGSQLATDELDRRVAERTRELEAANAELDAFSLLVSHDLRAPLANIAGLVKVLQHMPGAVLPPAGTHMLERVGANVVALNGLIESLLHFARMSRQPMRLAPVHLAPLVWTSLQVHAAEIEARQIDVCVQPMPQCLADAALIGQVFANLIANAVKYTRQRAQARIEIGSHQVAGEHLLYVRDNGAGFDMAQAEGLFTPFQRFHEASDFEGSGVGLAIVKQIVTRHGGRVWAESMPDQGACFTFTLPAGDRRG